MAATNNQKLKLLYILKFLQENTDENHIAHAEDIKLYLLNRGIAAERKSIYSDISILIDFGYDIIKSNGSGGGYFLASRDFELAELRLLSDAVQAANFISAKKTKQLLNKIFTLTSAEQAKKIKSQVYVDNRPKCKNEELYYTIDKLDRAINDNRKVKIIYRRRILSDNPDQAYEEKEHIISPYSLIWSSDHYYLVGNKEKYDNLMIMRIDRIKHTEIIDDSFSRPFSEVSPYKFSFDSADYASKHFGMFSGEPKPISLLCSNEIVENVLDRFGEDANIHKNGPSKFVLNANSAVNDGLVSWIIQFGGKIQVTSPNELKNMVLKRAEEIKSAYII